MHSLELKRQIEEYAEDSKNTFYLVTRFRDVKVSMPSQVAGFLVNIGNPKFLLELVMLFLNGYNTIVKSNGESLWYNFYPT